LIQNRSTKNPNPSLISRLKDTHLTDHCIRCQRGKHTNERFGASQCDICPPGSLGQQMTALTDLSPGGMVFKDAPLTNGKKDPGFVCIKCIPGKYLGEQTIDPTEEKKAVPSMKSDLPIVCKDCLAGFKQEKAGTTFCLPCDPGKTQGATGQKTCTDCGIGRYMDDTASNTAECKLCGKGTYGGDDEMCVPDVPDDNKCGGKEGLASCVSCWKGRYGNEEGLVFFEDCTEW